MAARGLPFAMVVDTVHRASTCRCKGVEDDRPVSRFVCNKSYDALPTVVLTLHLISALLCASVGNQ
jgi:hypothetical protein